MVNRRLALAGPVWLVGLIAALATAPAASHRTTTGITVGSFSSRALGGQVHYAVSLPPGYSGSVTRYPVVYVLHGLPATPAAFRDIAWVAGALRRSGRRAIVIGAQGARNGDADGEWHDWGSGRNWETATARELVSQVDRRYRTIAARSGRVLIGLSAGGYGAALIGYHHPRTFSVIQSWSGYFEPTNPDGTAVLDLGSKEANDRASLHALVPRLRRRLGPYSANTFFAFFVGSRDTRFLEENRRLSRELSRYGVPHTRFRTYDGDHSMDLWQKHARAWIARALVTAAVRG